MKRVQVAFADRQLERAFHALAEGRFEDRQLHAAIVRATKALEANPQYGIRVPSRLIPKLHVRKYGVNNLWKINLPRAWRLLYSVVADEVQIVSMVLEWLTHKEYERRFGDG